MPNTQEIQVPDIGDFDAVEIVEVLVNSGDAVEVEDPLITLESDKATMEVPSPLAGKVVEVKVKMGDKVGEGAVILVLEVDEVAVAEREPEPTPEKSTQEDPSPPAPETVEKLSGPEAAAPASPAPATPAPRPDLSLAPIDEFPHTSTYASSGSTTVRSRAGRRPGQSQRHRSQGASLERRRAGFRQEDPVSTTRPGRRGVARDAGHRFLPLWRSRAPAADPHPDDLQDQCASQLVACSPCHTARRGGHHRDGRVSTRSRRRSQSSRVQSHPCGLLDEGLRGCAAALPSRQQLARPRRRACDLEEVLPPGRRGGHETGLMVPVIRNVDQKGIFELAKELAETSEQARQGKLRPDQIRGRLSPSPVLEESAAPISHRSSTLPRWRFSECPGRR